MEEMGTLQINSDDDELAYYYYFCFLLIIYSLGKLRLIHLTSIIIFLQSCENFYDEGICIDACPPPEIYNSHTYKWEPNPDAKFAYGHECVKQCPGSFQMLYLHR